MSGQWQHMAPPFTLIKSGISLACDHWSSLVIIGHHWSIVVFLCLFMSFTRLQGMMNTIPQHIKHTLFAARPWEAPLEKSAWHSHGKDLHLVIATFWLL